MLSIKSTLAAVALAAAFLVVPATANAKVIHKASKLHTTKTHARRLHSRHVKHAALHTTHTKAHALAHKTHASAHTLSHAKSAHTPVTAGWKHHRSI